VFQQIGSHTHCPHRVHCLKIGEISCTAVSSAVSCCEPAAIDCRVPAVCAARSKMPPSSDAAASIAAAAVPRRFAWYEDR
jgi:hypothetical protein